MPRTKINKAAALYGPKGPKGPAPDYGRRPAKKAKTPPRRKQAVKFRGSQDEAL
jgi:hypothetical protein